MSDALDAEATASAFPVLEAGEIATLHRYGSEASIEPGQALFSVGEVHANFYVVLEGEATVVDGEGRLVVVHGPGRFVGDTALFTHQAALVSCSMPKGGRVLAVPIAHLQQVMGNEPALSEVILRAFLLRHALMTQRGIGLRVIGSRFDANSRAALHFLSQNRVAVAWVDVESDPDAEAILCALDVSVDDIPVIVTGRGVLRNPSLLDLADALAIGSHGVADDKEICDLVIVGAGPAGLAAAVYGASEGLATVLVDSTSIGGQAGTSSRIENYLGFPAGLSGEELATRATLQAEKFGARLMVPAEATSLSYDAGVHVLELANGSQLRSRTLIIATGARYRKLPVERLAEFEGAGVYYAATVAEANLCESNPVAIVGGGNSAGQAAIFLASRCRTVHMLIRRASLDATMSRYLINQIEDTPNIMVHAQTEVTALVGDRRLDAVSVSTGDGTVTDLEVTGLFVFIGADPCTQWMGDSVAGQDGFLYTGADIPPNTGEHAGNPLPLETSRPGVFCVGDARYGSVKRVASAVGEGSMAVRLVHERIAGLQTV